MLQKPQPRLFAAGEMAAFLGRAARQDDRPGSPLERPGDVRVPDGVEAQLHQVGYTRRLIPPGTELGEGGRRDGGAEPGLVECGHKIKKPLAPVW